jgi:hypothetical protein
MDERRWDAEGTLDDVVEPTPWIRRGRNTARAFCPFCGERSLLRSFDDDASDTGRVELYCDNSMCDAREIVILNTRGWGADQRADVRALDAVDHGYNPPAPPVRIMSGTEVLASMPSYEQRARWRKERTPGDTTPDIRATGSARRGTDE